MSRAENWIKWDLSSREDHATKWFINQYTDKASAYGFFLWMVEALYHANEHCLPEDEIFLDGFAKDIGWLIEDVKLAVARLCQAKLFFAKDGYIYSKRVLREVEARADTSTKRAESGRLGGLKKAENRMISTEPLASAKPLLEDAKQIVAKSSREIDRYIDKKEQIERENAPGEAPPPVEVDEDLEKAKSKLCEPTGNEIWEKSNAFILGGRRPMKDYPGLWLTSHELRDVILILKEQLPDGPWKDVFLDAQAEIQTQKIKGVKPELLGAYKYLTTYSLQNILRIKNEQVKIQKNSERGTYANN